jgi:hypothetical protein
MKEAADKAEIPIDLAPRFQSMLEGAGFVDIVVEKKVWPTNSWEQDPKLKLLGNLVLEGFKDLRAISMALFTRVLHWSSKETNVFLAKVRQNLENPAIHAYWEV